MFGEGVVQQGFPDVILRPGEEYRNQVRLWQGVLQHAFVGVKCRHDRRDRLLVTYGTSRRYVQPRIPDVPLHCPQVIWRSFQQAPSAAGGTEPATSSAVRRGLLRW